MSEQEKELREQDTAVDETAQDEATASEHTHNEAMSKLQEEHAQLYTRFQRLQADFDNHRKRVSAEKQEYFTQAVCDVMRELLPVLDNLERAKLASGSVESLVEGVEMVYKQLVGTLEKFGMEAIDACGQEFDPNCHYAIMQVECEQPENTVVEELQKGYKLKDRVIRPSMVKVAK